MFFAATVILMPLMRKIRCFTCHAATLRRYALAAMPPWRYAAIADGDAAASVMFATLI